MARRLLLLIALVGAVSAPALALADGGGLGDQKAVVDQKLATVQAKIAKQHAAETKLNRQIAGLTTQIQGLTRRVAGVSTRLETLQEDLELRQRRMQKLTELFRLQTIRFTMLKRSYALSVKRLNDRLLSMYKQNEPTTVDVVLEARSFDDVLDQLDYLSAVAKQDKRIAFEVAATKRRVRAARAKTRTVKQGVAREASVIKARAQQEAYLRSRLVAGRSQLAGSKAEKAQALVATQKQIADARRESEALAAASAQIEARIREAEARAKAEAGRTATTPGDSSSPAAPPAAPSGNGGFIWPVTGATMTSPFGPRWGSTHAGIDLAMPTGTPIRAAAGGLVIWCGWMSGYGYLVMIDHRNGLVTLYAHQSRVGVGCNQEVSQGQTIGYVGSTGISTGPHVHFEVRLRGTAVDPLGYLP